MKTIFDKVSFRASKMTTRSYSTSFSMGIFLLDRKLHDPIYAIYGFVRFADEIVDTFHAFDKTQLLQKFRTDTFSAIEQGISLNPILNSFQSVVNTYKIDHALIQTFLESMEMDLERRDYTPESYKKYIVGSAEVVGLMCLSVFTNGDETLYARLKPAAMQLGSAFQKVNFLRDIRNDWNQLGRVYFPSVDPGNFTQEDKKRIEREIREEFKVALRGIRQLPTSSRRGVYTAYVYYNVLFRKISALPPDRILQVRVRVPNWRKILLALQCYLQTQLRLI